MNKLLIIYGSTATGKTDLGVLLAKRFNGEIVSADSRQVYKGMDIGTGKDIPPNSKVKSQNAKLQFKSQKFTIGFREKVGIPIWLVDICEPDYRFNVGEYQKLAKLAIAEIWSRGKLPIIIGGTGLYIRSLIEPLDMMRIPPNISLRQKLDTYSIDALQKELQQLNLNRFQHMNESDRHNPRRLIRAIEVAMFQKIFPSYSSSEGIPYGIPESRSSLKASSRPHSNNNILLIGLTTSQEELEKRIDQRVEKRMQQGIITEIESMLKKGYVWKLPSMSALGYREWKEYFEASSNKEALKKNIIRLWKLHERQYAKRQMTYFKKMKGTNWFDITEDSYINRILDRVETWYNKNKEA